MRIKFLLPSIAAVAALLAGWWIESSAALRLQAELEAARFDQRTLRALEAERDRLRRLAPTDTELASLVEADAEHNRLQREIQARATPAAPFRVGEWNPATAWENRGRRTPRATIETALWAAAGGDTAALASLLEIDPTTRAKATELLSKLPPAARTAWATPEALIAGATTKDIPLTEAQIVWSHEHDADHAGIGLLLNTPAQATAPLSAAAVPSVDNAPPTLRDSHRSKLAMIALHRTADGWSLVVPPRAIDRIAGELLTASPPPSDLQSSR